MKKLLLLLSICIITLFFVGHVWARDGRGGPYARIFTNRNLPSDEQNTAPDTSDDAGKGYKTGDIRLDEATAKVYFCFGGGTWGEASGGGGSGVSLWADSGTTLSGASNFGLTAGTNITLTQANSGGGTFGLIITGTATAIGASGLTTVQTDDGSNAVSTSLGDAVGGMFLIGASGTSTTATGNTVYIGPNITELESLLSFDTLTGGVSKTQTIASGTSLVALSGIVVNSASASDASGASLFVKGTGNTSGTTPFAIGDSTGVVDFIVNGAGLVKVGAGTPTTATGEGDLYVKDAIEVGGAAKFLDDMYFGDGKALLWQGISNYPRILNLVGALRFLVSGPGEAVRIHANGNVTIGTIVDSGTSLFVSTNGASSVTPFATGGGGIVQFMVKGDGTKEVGPGVLAIDTSSIVNHSSATSGYVNLPLGTNNSMITGVSVWICGVSGNTENITAEITFHRKDDMDGSWKWKTITDTLVCTGVSNANGAIVTGGVTIPLFNNSGFIEGDVIAIGVDNPKSYELQTITAPVGNISTGAGGVTVTPLHQGYAAGRIVSKVIRYTDVWINRDLDGTGELHMSIELLSTPNSGVTVYAQVEKL